jgi:phosphatidylserine decarboxylase
VRKTPLRSALSRLVGWAADRRIPGPLRAPLYRGYARLTGANLSETRLPPEHFPSLGAFFVRHLAPDARPIDQDPAALVSPVDGAVQVVGPVERGRTLQAKGRDYALQDLVGPLAERLELEGGTAWTLYLSPRDYHRIHAPESCRVEEAWWIPGARFSVAPPALDRRLVLPVNERVALRLATERGPLALVLVGATNVGRIRVVGVEPGHGGPLAPAPRFARGEELARFELGSTVVLVAPRGAAEPVRGLEPGAPVRLGRPIGRWRGAEPAA